MSKGIKKFAAALLMLTFFLTSLTTGAFAASDKQLKFNELNLSYWVEYDQPEKWNKNDPAVLLMYNGSVVNNSTEPFDGELGFYIPENAQINMVCETEKGMICQPYKISKTDKGSYLTWKVTRAIQPGEKFPFMVELYYNPIIGTADKTIDYTFTASLDIDTLNIDVKEPLKGTNFQITPAATQTASDKENFKYDLYNLTNVKAEESKSFKISYRKEGSEPSVAGVPGQQSEQPESGLNTTKLNVPAVFGIVAFVGILGGFFFVALKGNNNNSKAKVASKVKNTKPSKEKTNNSIETEKRKARKLLLDGKISEETYQEIVSDLDL